MELRRIQTAAEKQGYAAGLAQGAADAKKNAAEQAERLASIAAALYRARTSVLDSAQDALVELATIAVCRILGEQAVSPAGVAGAVHQALRQCGLRGKLVLRLHPQDCTLLREIAGAQASLPATVDLQADAAVGLGGCIVENESGKLDARLDTQMARLAETLLAVRRRIGSGGEAI
jgi:flagellar assembly protein FliH